MSYLFIVLHLYFLEKKVIDHVIHKKNKNRQNDHCAHVVLVTEERLHNAIIYLHKPDVFKTQS